MNFKIISVVLFLIIQCFLAANSYAQGSSGAGGGDVVVCYDKDEQVIDMIAYDFWNAGNKKFNLTIPIDSKTPYMDQIYANMKQIEKIDPLLASWMTEQSKIFDPDKIQHNDLVSFVPKIQNNGDGIQTILPEDTDSKCYTQVVVRMAEFKVNPLPFEKPFKINSKLWGKANESVKYAIIKHELLYRAAKKYLNELDSTKTQLVNAYLSSTEFNTVTPQSYISFFKALSWDKKPGLFSVNLMGKFFDIASVQIIYNSENSNLIDYYYGKLALPHRFKLNDVEITSVAMTINSEGNIISFNSKYDVPLVTVNNQFFIFEAYSKIILNSDQKVLAGTLKNWAKLNVENSNIMINSFVFDSNGDLKSINASLCEATPKFKYHGKTYSSASKGVYLVNFSETGVHFSKWSNCEISSP